jgi:virginiamycin B lyase
MRTAAASVISLALFAAPAVSNPLAAQPDSMPLSIKEWTVPWEKSRPRDPAVAPDGKVFFVGQVGNYIGRLDPQTGEFKKYEIDPGTNPHNLIIDAKGQVWYAGNRNRIIGRLDPATGAISRYPMPDSTARDPHTQVFDKQGNIWFTLQQSNFVGHLSTATGKIELVKMTTPRALPYGITLDPEGRPYFDLFGTNKIGTIDPKTMTLKEYSLPDPRSRPRRIARTTDGHIWYVDYTRGFLGRLDPKNGETKEWKAPAGPASLPYAMTVDDADRLWFVETGVQPNRLVGFDPKTERFFSVTPIPSGAGTIRYMIFDPKSRQIWFGTDANTIGRVPVPPAKATTT